MKKKRLNLARAQTLVREIWPVATTPHINKWFICLGVLLVLCSKAPFFLSVPAQAASGRNSHWVPGSYFTRQSLWKWGCLLRPGTIKGSGLSCAVSVTDPNQVWISRMLMSAEYDNAFILAQFTEDVAEHPLFWKSLVPHYLTSRTAIYVLRDFLFLCKCP